jgi:hypothetical protein
LVLGILMESIKRKQHVDKFVFKNQLT